MDKIVNYNLKFYRVSSLQGVSFVSNIHVFVYNSLSLHLLSQGATVIAHDESRDISMRQLEEMEKQCSDLSNQVGIVSDQIVLLQANGKAFKRHLLTSI